MISVVRLCAHHGTYAGYTQHYANQLHTSAIKYTAWYKGCYRMPLNATIWPTMLSNTVGKKIYQYIPVRQKDTYLASIQSTGQGYVRYINLENFLEHVYEALNKELAAKMM